MAVKIMHAQPQHNVHLKSRVRFCKLVDLAIPTRRPADISLAVSCLLLVIDTSASVTVVTTDPGDCWLPIPA